MIQLTLGGSARGRRQRRRYLVLKIVLALLGAAVWLYVILTRASDDLRDLASEFGIAAVGVIVFAVANAFLVEPLTRAFSRKRSRPKAAPSIEWMRVTRMRVRLWWERLDLLDTEGKVVGSIDHHDPDADAILRRVVEITNRMRPPEITLPHRIRGGVFAGQDAALWFVYLFGAVVTTLMFLDGKWDVGLVMLGLFLVPFVSVESAHLLRLELTRDELVLRYPWKTRRLPRERVREVSIAFAHLEGNAKRLVTSVSSTREKPVEITPDGADHLEVYRAVVAWLRAT